VCAVVLAMAASLFSQSTAPQSTSQSTSQDTRRRSRIKEEIDSTQLVTLRGHVRPDLTAERDMGVVEDELPLRLYLVLQRSPEQQAELDNLLARQQQPTAPEYHRWLTPQEFGARFGASQDDIAKVTAWLEGQGMAVQGVMNNAMFIDFAATARQVREVFHTQLHYYNIQGGRYAANAQDPMIPAALAEAVAGIKGLSKIPHQSHRTKVHQASYDAATHSWNRVDEGGAEPAYDFGGGEYDVTPQDYYTIYNVNPVFTGGNLGATATVAVVEQSDFEFGTVNATTGVTTGGDVATFRSQFGVQGTLNMHVYHGYGTTICNAPGIDPEKNGEEAEAALDAEWANALAPAANLIFMSCDQSPHQGTDTSMTALIDNNLGDSMSMSYGSSELNFAPGDYTFYDKLFAQAAAQGQSFFVSAGDSGSDMADQNTTGTATSGYNVNAFGSPNVTVAGGTDFADAFDAAMGGRAQSNYWGANKPNYYESALGYIPETAWNDGCASSIRAAWANNTYTGAEYCATAPSNYLDGEVVGGSGGFSKNYPVPSYQQGITGYSGTMRAQPDISGFAAAGGWGHALIFCDSYQGQFPCTSSKNFGEAGGTSFVAPQMAGVAGLLRSATGARQGLLNPELYALAKAQFTAAGTATACYSNGQTSNAGLTVGLPAAGCIFNDVTTSNNDVPCKAGSTECYVNSGATYGMLSLSGVSSLKVAYPSTPGYDEATGLGTVNVDNLITNWGATAQTFFTSTTTLTAAPTSITSSQTTTLTAVVTGGTPSGFTGSVPAVTGSVTFTAGTASLGNCALSNGSCGLVVSGSALQSGSDSISATYSGNSSYPASASIIELVTVTGTSTTTLTAAPTSITSSQTTTLTAVVTGGAPSGGTAQAVSGSVNFNAGSASLGNCTLNSGNCVLVVSGSALQVGANSITATYSGNSSYTASMSGIEAVTVTGGGSLPSPMGYTVTPSATTATASAGSSASVTLNLVSTGYTGAVTFTTNITLNGVVTNAVLASVPTVNLSSNGTGNTTLTITANSNAKQTHPARWQGSGAMVLAMLLGAPFTLRRRRLVAVLLTAFAILLAGLLMSCGSSNSANNNQTPPVTPTSTPRTYNVTVTPTSNPNVTNPAPVTIVVTIT
jgi:hypothetical protein